MRLLLAAAVLSLAACSGGNDKTDGATEAPAKPHAASLYESGIAPLFANACATCHLTGTEAGNLSLVPARAIENLVGVKSTEVPGLVRVQPGEPDQSYLIMKLEGTHVQNGGTGAQMPFGAPPLPPEVIARVRLWIEKGATP
ncbi:MAG: hypothetical protein R3E09_09745 [Novosphingobium sp.]|nr:hypothetical protein [Novosphingobium sp.]